MKHDSFYIGLLSFFFLCSLFVSDTQAQQREDEPSPYEKVIELHWCTDDTLGVRFLCSGDWSVMQNDGVSFIVISENPQVTMTITRLNSTVISLRQLTNPVLQQMGQYEDEFSTTYMQVGGSDAVYVEGISKEFPSKRLGDYYVLHDLDLFGVLYTVDPKEAWPDYADLFRKLTDSVTFTY